MWNCPIGTTSGRQPRPSTGRDFTAAVVTPWGVHVASPCPSPHCDLPPFCRTKSNRPSQGWHRPASPQRDPTAQRHDPTERGTARHGPHPTSDPKARGRTETRRGHDRGAEPRGLARVGVRVGSCKARVVLREPLDGSGPAGFDRSRIRLLSSPNHLVTRSHKFTARTGFGMRMLLRREGVHLPKAPTEAAHRATD